MAGADRKVFILTAKQKIFDGALQVRQADNLAKEEASTKVRKGDNMEAGAARGDNTVAAVAAEPARFKATTFNATVLKRTKRSWNEEELKLLWSLGRVVISRNSIKIIAVEGCHSKAIIARALKLDPERLGENDIGCEFGEVRFS